jgi:hypothetical protein
MDIHEFYRSCDSYQKIGGLKTKSLTKLVTTLPKEPFMKWGLNFISPIKQIGRLTWNIYVIIATNYATKWVETRYSKLIL